MAMGRRAIELDPRSFVFTRNQPFASTPLPDAITWLRKAVRQNPQLSLLELPADLDNVSKSCRVMGYSRQQFYEIRRNFSAACPHFTCSRCPASRMGAP